MGPFEKYKNSQTNAIKPWQERFKIITTDYSLDANTLEAIAVIIETGGPYWEDNSEHPFSELATAVRTFKNET